VCLATDTKLGREVAIKVLPAELANDAERLSRFEREAKLLASLNHPNVAQVYGFGSATLADGSSGHFLAMELVEGEELAERLSRGPIPLEEAIPIARQIAEGLEEAHEKGIVHRDLKPANVKVTPDGRVKVLDFGLAKADAGAAAADSGADLSQSPTMARTETQAGVILGTAGYMSPEQARGKRVDKRADVWSFGVVLFEMLTGRPLFSGETLTDVLASVTREEPDWAALPPATPAAIHRLLRRCLTRDPRQRLQSIGEARIALEAPLEPTTGPMRPSRLGGRWALPGLALLAVGLLLLGYAAGTRLGGRSPGASPDVRFQQLTFGRGTLWSARFAPDGETVIYSAAWDGNPIRLFLTRLDTRDSSPLALPDAHLLGLSSRGELAISLGHRFDGYMGEGTLARAPLLGTGARPILERVRDADWSPDGAGLAVVRRVGAHERLEYPADRVLYETSGWVSHIRFSPAGDRIAFIDHPIWSDDIGQVSVVDLQGHKRDLTEFSGRSVRGLVWSPTGDEIWFSTPESETTAGLAIWAVDLDGRLRALLSSPAPLVLYDVSSSGRLLLGREGVDRRVEAQVAGSAGPRDFTLPRENTIGRVVSEDGELVLVSETTTGNYSSYAWRADGSPPVRLGDGLVLDLSPDSRWVLALEPDQRPRLLIHPVGAGQTREVPNPTSIQFDMAGWVPDGRSLVAFGAIPGGSSRGWVLDPDGAAPPRAFTPEGIGVTSNASRIVISPDGSRVVAPDGTGGYAAYPLSGGAAEPVPGLREPDLPLQWTADGEALFVARSGEAVWTVRRLDLTSGAEQPWATIAPHDTAGLRLTTLFITRNGRFWVRDYSRLLVDLFVAEGVR